ncbi:hypothetical protein C7S18_17690 [Ahniella affigens]|uniref:Metallo-beta-lactamase domain-containing protein n=1 Tax=Ahniella affigens TaxID=2021234 RepID=A0A2P1PVM3_9GAMM|nr:hypothetical protein C7S18_17690 [Ahniella affigens]
MLLCLISLDLVADCPAPRTSLPAPAAATLSDDDATWAPGELTAAPWPEPGPAEDWMDVVTGDPEIPHARRLLQIYTLPVGAGNCQLMLCPNQNRMIMFDCGALPFDKVGWNKADVSAFIANLINPNTSISVSISHTHYDHNSYLPDVLANRRISTIVMSDTPQNYPANVRNWMRNAYNQGTRVLWKSGIYRSQAPEPPLSCYKPEPTGGWSIDVQGYVVMMNAGANPNDASMVIAQRYGRFQTVFTGDMTGETEQRIDNNLPVPLNQTTVITGAHHGSDSHDSNNPSWAIANQAEAVMFSAGGLFWHPRCAAAQTYRPYLLQFPRAHNFQCGRDHHWARGPTRLAAYSTNINGAIRVRADANGRWDIGARLNALDDLNAIALESLKRADLMPGPDTLYGDSQVPNTATPDIDPAPETNCGDPPPEDKAHRPH